MEKARHFFKSCGRSRLVPRFFFFPLSGCAEGVGSVVRVILITKFSDPRILYLNCEHNALSTSLHLSPKPPAATYSCKTFLWVNSIWSSQISGDAGAGKTQICLQLLLQVGVVEWPVVANLPLKRSAVTRAPTVLWPCALVSCSTILAYFEYVSVTSRSIGFAYRHMENIFLRILP